MQWQNLVEVWISCLKTYVFWVPLWCLCMIWYAWTLGCKNDNKYGYVLLYLSRSKLPRQKKKKNLLTDHNIFEKRMLTNFFFTWPYQQYNRLLFESKSRHAEYRTSQNVGMQMAFDIILQKSTLNIWWAFTWVHCTSGSLETRSGRVIFTTCGCGIQDFNAPEKQDSPKLGTGWRISIEEESGMWDFHKRGAGMWDQDPLPDPVEELVWT